MRNRFKSLYILLLTITLLSPAAFSADFTRLKERLSQKYPHLTMINVTELHRELNDREYVLLDARTPAEYSISHLDGANNAPDIAAALHALQGQEKHIPIVTYCSLGYRSAELASQLQEHGYTEVRNLAGSLFEWVDYDYPVYREENPVRKVHPYNLWWGRYLRRDYHSYKKP